MYPKMELSVTAENEEQMKLEALLYQMQARDNSCKTKEKMFLEKITGTWKLLEMSACDEYFDEMEYTEEERLSFTNGHRICEWKLEDGLHFFTTYTMLDGVRDGEESHPLSYVYHDDDNSTIAYLTGDTIKVFFLSEGDDLNNVDRDEYTLKDDVLTVSCYFENVKCVRKYEKIVSSESEILKGSVERENDFLRKELKNLSIKCNELTTRTIELQQRIDCCEEVTREKPIKESIVGEWKRNGKTLNYSFNEDDLVEKKDKKEEILPLNQSNTYLDVTVSTEIIGNKIVTTYLREGLEIMKWTRSVESGVLKVVHSMDGKDNTQIWERTQQ